MILFRLPIKPRTKFTLPGFLLSCSLGLKACDCSCKGYNKVRNKKGRQSMRSWKSFFIISNYVSMNSLILTEVTEQLGPGKNKKIIQLFSCFEIFARYELANTALLFGFLIYFWRHYWKFYLRKVTFVWAITSLWQRSI